MSFTIADYHDLIDLLANNPQWRAGLRQLLLSDELLALPDDLDRLAVSVNELVEAQKRTEARVEQLAQAQQRTETRVEQLAEAQQRTEARLDALTARVDALTAQVAELTMRVDELARITGVLVEQQQRMQDKLARLDGRTLEAEFRYKATACFGRWLKRLRVVELQALEDSLEAGLASHEFEDLLRLDLLLTGRLRQQPEQPEIWLAVEVSAVVDRGDVARARRRADLLRKAGYRTIPVAAGEQMTQGAELEAREQGVALLQDGRMRLWEDALTAG